MFRLRRNQESPLSEVTSQETLVSWTPPESPWELSPGFAGIGEEQHSSPTLLLQRSRDPLSTFQLWQLQVSLHLRRSVKELTALWKEYLLLCKIVFTQSSWRHQAINTYLDCHRAGVQFAFYYDFLHDLWIHMQVLSTFLTLYERKVFRAFHMREVCEQPLTALASSPQCCLGGKVSVEEQRHTSFFQLVNRLSFVHSQNNNTECTCLLQKLAFCDPKGKPPAELDKDGSIVTGFLC